MIRVVLPSHLRELARVTGELHIEVNGTASQVALLDAIELRYPMLRGAVRNQETHKRRAMVRFFACQRDLSHELPETPLPDSVVNGVEPFLIVAAIAGG